MEIMDVAVRRSVGIPLVLLRKVSPVQSNRTETRIDRILFQNRDITNFPCIYALSTMVHFPSNPTQTTD
jgi:hypothetical protein